MSAPTPIIVLLVDDQVIIGAAVRMLLAGEPDVKFHFCVDPALAIERANEIAPSVILQDLQMPQVSGLELVQRFRANPTTARTPIIVLSGSEDSATKERALAGGADDYLVKVPARADLLERIRFHASAQST